MIPETKRAGLTNTQRAMLDVLKRGGVVTQIAMFAGATVALRWSVWNYRATERCTSRMARCGPLRAESATMALERVARINGRAW